MRIGLISDTHIPEARPELWPQVFDAFRGVDLILHAGDVHELRVIDELEAVAPIYVARGNGDDGSGGRPALPDDERLTCGHAPDREHAHYRRQVLSPFRNFPHVRQYRPD